MKNIFEKLNEEQIDLTEYDKAQLTDIERAATKKRIKAKLKKRTNNKTRILGFVASVAIIMFIGMNSKYALADLPIIGSAIEKFVYSKEHSLQDYKTVLGESVRDNGVKVTLNEVMLDEGRLLISSTFHSDFSDEDLEWNWFPEISIYINGKEQSTAGGGGPQQINNTSLIHFWDADVGNLNLEDEHDIKIMYKNLRRSDSKKMKEGKWSFEFTASGKNLLAERESITIDKNFVLDDGQEVIVEDLIITPVSTTLYYNMKNVSTNVYFKIEDQNGHELQGVSARGGNSSDNSMRFVAIEDHISKLKIIPYTESSIIEGRKMNILHDQAFEIDVK